MSKCTGSTIFDQNNQNNNTHDFHTYTHHIHDIIHPIVKRDRARWRGWKRQVAGNMTLLFLYMGRKKHWQRKFFWELPSTKKVLLRAAVERNARTLCHEEMPREEKTRQKELWKRMKWYCVSRKRASLILYPGRLKVLEQVEEIFPWHQISPVSFRIRRALIIDPWALQREENNVHNWSYKASLYYSTPIVSWAPSQ